MTEVFSLRNWIIKIILSINTSVLHTVNLRLGHTRFEMPGYLLKYAQSKLKISILGYRIRNLPNIDSNWATVMMRSLIQNMKMNKEQHVTYQHFHQLGLSLTLSSRKHSEFWANYFLWDSSHIHMGTACIPILLIVADLS